MNIYDPLYKIIGKHKGHKETIDHASDLDEANYLTKVYKEMYDNDWHVWFEKYKEENND